MTVNEKKGIIDTIGDFILKPKYDSIDLSDGIAVARIMSNSGQYTSYAFDEKGNQLFTCNDYL